MMNKIKKSTGEPINVKKTNHIHIQDGPRLYSGPSIGNIVTSVVNLDVLK